MASSGGALRLATGRLILVPALITLGVTLLRLVGELQRWSPRLFSREAGGAGALVGIVWLVPLFGIYFGLKLKKAGYGSASKWRPIAYCGLALVLFVLVNFVTIALKVPAVWRIATVSLVSLLCIGVAYRGWPALGRVELWYGIAARVPVAVVMLIAIFANWGTHYELGAPDFPEMSPVPKWFWIGLLPQMTFWIAFTVLFGGLFGGVAAAFGESRAKRAT